MLFCYTAYYRFTKDYKQCCFEYLHSSQHHIFTIMSCWSLFSLLIQMISKRKSSMPIHIGSSVELLMASNKETMQTYLHLLQFLFVITAFVNWKHYCQKGECNLSKMELKHTTVRISQYIAKFPISSLVYFFFLRNNILHEQ